MTIRRAFLFLVVVLAAIVSILLPSALHRREALLATDPLLGDVYLTMDTIRPGLGVTDYPGNLVADIPKGYAMVLMAELERKRHGIEPSLPDMSTAAGTWLLANARLDPTGHVGWGVPAAWDAYGDGSVNPRDTAYGISTGIVVGALLDWMEADPDAPGPAILSVVEEALTGFADPSMRTPAGLVPYSLVATDTGYDTFNSAAYIAGEMQRFVKYASSPEVAEYLRSAADGTVRSLVDHRQLSPFAAWYWKYSVQENVTNDLAHATYIVQGLRTYVEEAGSLAGEVDMPAVVAHLGEFAGDNELVRGWPSVEAGITTPARLYDLGMALTFACRYPELDELKRKILGSVNLYRDGARFQRYPKSGEVPDIVVTEYENYLWRGLISCAVNDRADDTGEAGTEGGPPSSPFPAEGSSFTVPLVSLPTGAAVQMVGEGKSMQFTTAESRYEGIPLTVLDDGAGGVAVLRDVLGTGLSIAAISAEGALATPIELLGDGLTALEFRAGIFNQGILSLVVYDNPRQANFLTHWVRSDTGYVANGEALKLPSLEDPAGGTYEMIPKVYLLPAPGGLWIVGGTLQARWSAASGALVEDRIDNCSRVVEAVVTTDGPATLCVQKEEIGPSAPFSINAPPGVAIPEIGNLGVPFNLRVEPADRLALDMADEPEEFASMLAFDLGRLSNGWMEFGIENTEGRVPWSQLYYLNGFLDFLLQSERDHPRWTVFDSILSDIRRRLTIETQLLDNVWSSDLYKTRAFSVDRSPQLFAVQTARLLLFFDRYRTEVADVEISSFPDLAIAVGELRDHIEHKAVGGQSSDWLPAEATYLQWPKGSAFYFDGLNVPFNHQNEWAYAVTRVGLGQEKAAADIHSHFLRRIAPDGYFPMTGEWDYWWGKAFDGWNVEEAISENRPDYGGDRGAAWISFRSIDAMSILSFANRMPPRIARAVRQSAAQLVQAGHLYPFVNFELARTGHTATLPDAVARRYIRVSSPWEIQNAAWAYGAMLDGTP